MVARKTGSRFSARCSSLREDRRGAVTIISAVLMTAFLTSLAFAVDLGSIYFESRRLQGLADAAALSAVGNLDNPNAAAQQAIDANGWDGPVDITVATGAYTPDPALSVDKRFDGSATTPDAARVTLKADAKLFFGIAALGTNHIRIQRTATAARSNLASFSIGSRLLALQGGIANALLTQLTGSSVSLSVMDYQQLLNANLDLLSFSKNLQTQLNLQGASFDKAFSADVATGTALNVMATTLDGSGQTGASAAIRALGAGGTGTLKFGDLIDLGPYAHQDHAAKGQAINVNAFDLLRGMLELASGERQVTLNLNSSVPGLLNTSVKLSVGDRMADSPWIAITNSGEPVVSTAQTRLFIDTSVLPASGLGLYGIATVRLPLYVELAEAQAKLTSISCTGLTGPRAVSLQVQPSVGHVSITDVYPADISDHRTALIEGPARIIGAPLLAVTGQARIDLSGSGWQTVSFDTSDISSGTVKTVSSSDFVQGITASLVQKTKLQVSLGTLGLNLSAVTNLVGASLTPAAPAVDSLLESLLGILGIHLGQADVRVNGVRCGQAALVA